MYYKHSKNLNLRRVANNEKKIFFFIQLKLLLMFMRNIIKKIKSIYKFLSEKKQEMKNLSN